MKKSVFPNFALKKLGTFVAIIVIFIHNVVLDRDLKCNCEAPGRGCNSFMAMPFFIIFFVQLWTDKTFLRAWKYACTSTCISSVWALLCHIIKAGFIGLIWVISVLIDGDWWVCCKSDKKLACKPQQNLTAQDHTTIAELKIESLIAGMSTLLAILLLAFISSFVPKNCSEESRRYNMKIQYYSVVLDEEENVLKEILTKSAKDQLTGIIINNTWDKWYVAAEDVLKKSPEPSLSQQQQEDLKKCKNPSNSNNSNGRDGAQDNDTDRATGQPGENLPLMERHGAAGNQVMSQHLLDTHR
ncbi:uncharacterized protein LOC125892440 isoform X3 [Epinephelus fuscoguttatus]|uniref:uncharacterized protein LOC125892440 isoform X2 n=1 Tax=Epinephelus fuscoguttatus TaxID=293821 RepID=UPI0020CFF9A3|nr:uncharacterized protein LOC125892440 isoform X2 [Epinephelus fuscoguttatus]XP_049438423.1 uncharacterized protein LOC125892440 isoform X3 [Epinephelus fuscoguttatus]